MIPAVQSTVEDLRHRMWTGLEIYQDVEILAIKRGASTPDVFLNSKQPLVVYNDQTAIIMSWYNTYIRPALPSLAASCGATHVAGTQQQQVQLNKHGSTQIETIEAQTISIHWNKDCHLMYTMAPKQILPSPQMDQGLYQLQQKGKLCDFSLKNKEESIPVHSAVLFMRGGPVLQTLLESNMKETKEGAINFPEYSKATLQALIDFLYLDGPAFLKTYQEKVHTIDLTELFVFANTYQISSLIDCCTNLLSLYAQPEQVEALEPLAQLYKNKYLQDLCTQLRKVDNIS